MKTLDILNELSEHITVKINSYLEETHDAHWRESKVHNDYDLWLMLEGRSIMEVNGSVYTAEEGDVVFFYPGLSYSAFAEGKGCRFIYVHFDFSIGNNFRILNDFNFAGVISREALGEEAGIFQRGWQEYKKSGVPSLLLKGYFMILVSRVLDAVYREGHKNQSFLQNHPHKSNGKMSVLKPVFQYIAENMNKKIKICELSAIACMSEKYFINFFKEAIGIPPLVYINQLKMNRARSYLYQGSYSIKQISTLLGYSDQYTFSKAFKKYFNVSPSKFL